MLSMGGASLQAHFLQELCGVVLVGSSEVIFLGDDGG